MANNFGSTTARISTDALGTIITATSNKQIIIGFLISNTGTASIKVDAILNDGTNDRYIIKNANILEGGSLELVSGKYVIPSGGSVKFKSSSSTGGCDVIISTLEDVT